MTSQLNRCLHFLCFFFWLCCWHSGAYPMPSCVASTCLSVHLINFKSNWLLTLYLIFLMFGLNVHNNISRKPVELEFWSFAFCFVFSDDQAALRTLISVCPSVCHTCFTMFLSSYHHSGLWLQFEFTDGNEMMQKPYSGIEEVPYCFSRSSVKFQGHTGRKIDNFYSNLAIPDCNSRSLRFASFN